ncbi:MAG: DUF192 domain-containing protein [Spirochaetia bacterium]|nr:DUF192 domain-containing protein [Spirochaetia bacterium]
MPYYLQRIIDKKILLFTFFLILLQHLLLNPLFSEDILFTNKAVIYITNAKKNIVSLNCDMAVSDTEKNRGLMFRKKLEKNDGMIFIYNEPEILTFWMKNTQIPLSIAFVNKDNRITEIYDMKPNDERIISSTTKAKYAIEANKGWFHKNYITTGAKISIVPN